MPGTEEQLLAGTETSRLKNLRRLKKKLNRGTRDEPGSSDSSGEGPDEWVRQLTPGCQLRKPRHGRTIPSELVGQGGRGRIFQSSSRRVESKSLLIEVGSLDRSERSLLRLGVRFHHRWWGN